jgi:hypothetical protein
LEAISGGLQDYATLDFNESLLKNPLFIDSSKYYTQISYYLEVLPSTSLKIVFFEDLKSNPQAVMDDVFDFLQVDPVPVDISINNQSEGKLMESSTTLMMRKIPGFSFLKNILPKSLRMNLKNNLKTTIINRPSWSESTKEFVVKEIQGDIINFLEYSGKETNFWNLDSYFKVN